MIWKRIIYLRSLLVYLWVDSYICENCFIIKYSFWKTATPGERKHGKDIVIFTMVVTVIGFCNMMSQIEEKRKLWYLNCLLAWEKCQVHRVKKYRVNNKKIIPCMGRISRKYLFNVKSVRLRDDLCRNISCKRVVWIVRNLYKHRSIFNFHLNCVKHNI